MSPCPTEGAPSGSQSSEGKGKVGKGQGREGVEIEGQFVLFLFVAKHSVFLAFFILHWLPIIVSISTRLLHSLLRINCQLTSNVSTCRPRLVINHIGECNAKACG